MATCGNNLYWVAGQFRPKAAPIVIAFLLITIPSFIFGLQRLRSKPPPIPRTDQVTWYLHRSLTSRSFSLARHSTFVTFAANQPVPSPAPLRSGLTDPRAFAVSHLLLVNGPVIAQSPGSFDSDCEQRDMALALQTKGSVTLEDRPDGSCVATIDGLRVVLRPIEKKGNYFGSGRVDHTIYVATATIDASQQFGITSGGGGRTHKAMACNGN